MMGYHVHMLISIPPKYSVSQVMGYIKGKSAIHLARVYGIGKGTLRGKVFGPGATLCRLWGEMKKSSATTFDIKSRKMKD